MAMGQSFQCKRHKKNLLYYIYETFTIYFPGLRGYRFG